MIIFIFFILKNDVKEINIFYINNNRYYFINNNNLFSFNIEYKYCNTINNIYRIFKYYIMFVYMYF